MHFWRRHYNLLDRLAHDFAQRMVRPPSRRDGFLRKYSQIHLIEKSSIKVSPLLGVDIVTITPLGYFVHTTHIDYVIADSVNLAYADDGDRLFLLSKDAHRLAQGEAF